jgi:hypothetical protein
MMTPHALAPLLPVASASHSELNWSGHEYSFDYNEASPEGKIYLLLFLMPSADFCWVGVVVYAYTIEKILVGVVGYCGNMGCV